MSSCPYFSRTVPHRGSCRKAFRFMASIHRVRMFTHDVGIFFTLTFITPLTVCSYKKEQIVLFHSHYCQVQSHTVLEVAIIYSKQDRDRPGDALARQTGCTASFYAICVFSTLGHSITLFNLISTSKGNLKSIFGA